MSVHVTVAVEDIDALGGTTGTAGASLMVSPYFPSLDGDTITSAAAFTVALEAGVGSFDLAPLEVRLIQPVGVVGLKNVRWVVRAPAVVSISLAQLVRDHSIDPATLDPIASPSPIWEAELDDLARVMVTGLTVDAQEVYLTINGNPFVLAGTLAPAYQTGDIGFNQNFGYTGDAYLDFRLIGSQTWNFAPPSYEVDGQQRSWTCLMRFTQGTTSTRSVTWNGAIKWAGGVRPVMPTGAGANMVVRVTALGPGWIGELVGYNFA